MIGQNKEQSVNREQSVILGLGYLVLYLIKPQDQIAHRDDVTPFRTSFKFSSIKHAS
jgi:hypothetical protein